jgi:hypothetical protein
MSCDQPSGVKPPDATHHHNLLRYLLWWTHAAAGNLLLMSSMLDACMPHSNPSPHNTRLVDQVGPGGGRQAPPG